MEKIILFIGEMIGTAIGWVVGSILRLLFGWVRKSFAQAKIQSKIQYRGHFPLQQRFEHTHLVAAGGKPSFYSICFWTIFKMSRRIRLQSLSLTVRVI
jgi:hypothetical protein